MSAARVQKLENLLQRVQQNRQLERSAPAATAAAATPDAPPPALESAVAPEHGSGTPSSVAAAAVELPMPGVVNPDGAGPAAQPAPRSRPPSATPLEIAVQSQTPTPPPPAPTPEPVAAPAVTAPAASAAPSTQPATADASIDITVEEDVDESKITSVARPAPDAGTTGPTTIAKPALTATGSVVAIASPAPSLPAITFGELIKASLSLRTRDD